MEDQPLQGDKMRDALSVIAEVRDTHRLREFLSTGRDSKSSLYSLHAVTNCLRVSVEDTSPENALDMPRGLNQLGNTCYLNSLLQVIHRLITRCS